MRPEHHGESSDHTLKLSHTQEALDLLAKVEGQFEQVKQGLTQLQKLSTLGTLAATVIHEFNNILTPIISYAQLALAKPDNPELARKAHTKALEGAERASQLCASLLGYVRDTDPDQGADLAIVVQSSVECLGHGLETQGIKLSLDVPQTRLAIPPGDLEQVMINLLLNARKAMTPNGGTLSISAQLDQDSVTIDIADTGRGVPAEVADHLFEPFVTFNPSPSANQQQGTGLGLSVCRDLITAAHGRITFTSNPGQGTTFHITLPLSEPLRQSA